MVCSLPLMMMYEYVLVTLDVIMVCSLPLMML